MAQPPLVLDPLPAAATAPGLFDAAGGIHDLPEHGYNNGAVWQADTCTLALANPTPCKAPPYTAFTAQSIEGLSQAFPFAVYASLFTGALGIDNDEAVRRVRQRVVLTEQNVAEQAFWGGGAGGATLLTLQQNYGGTTPGTAGGGGIAGVAGGVLEQFVAANSGYFSLGTATTVTDAVSKLEQSAAANYYGQAIIHARPRLAAYFGKAGLIRVIGLPPETNKAMIYSQNWNTINFGNGYPGTGPTGQAIVDGTSEYLWATGRVVIWRSPDIFVSPPDQLLDKTANQRGIYAFRNYMIGIECFAAVVQITALAP